MLISFDEIVRTLSSILKRYGFRDDRADACASLFAENSLEGVHSHGINRFPRFTRQIERNEIVPGAEPEKRSGSGAFEQWTGNRGPGPLNAILCTDHAMALARQYGMGCIALASTNHWLRGGTYGWRAARAGFGFMCWTNTEPNMPAWQALDARLGNNPFIIAVPRGEESIVLDMAMSQFSYGKLEVFAREKRKLPVAGGFNEKGELTDNPSKIIESWRALPIGYWKGSGFSLLLDLMAAVLSGGLATWQIGERESEYDVSQVFIAWDLQSLPHADGIEKIVSAIIEDYRNSEPASPDVEFFYPGERARRFREEYLKNGIPVDDKVWKRISSLEKGGPGKPSG